MRFKACIIACTALIACGSAAFPLTTLAAEPIEEIRIVGRRLPPAMSEKVYNASFLDRTDLSSGAATRLDDALRQVPGFGLFRRQSSRASHPTTQGVSLRGLGPSGAGRTLVLLDGVPQNDPFGGWIDWSRLPSAAFESVTVVRGGGAGPWGNAALAGVVSLQSRIEPDRSSGWLETRVDSFGSFDGTMSVQGKVGEGRLFALAHGHSGDGPYLIREDQRGPVDLRTTDKGGWLQAGGSFNLDESTAVTVTANTSSNRYLNGVVGITSVTRVSDAAVGIVHNDGDGPSWEAHAYHRDQDFKSLFGGVNEARTVVTPALNQFAVPAKGTGANALMRIPVTEAVTLQTGVDLRYAEGTTNENFTFTGGQFTRERNAGGKQSVLGAFAEADWQAADGIVITSGARVDRWKQYDGHRRETDLISGAVLRNDAYADKSGTVGNFRLGARADLNDELSARAAIYTGFRIPTLNELYRPFRVGNDITEANPDLVPERMVGGEAGIMWEGDGASLSATYFHTRLKRAVTNITIQTTPGLNPQLGVFVPAGGVLRQRRNLDRIEADGIELGGTWQLAETVEIQANYLFTSPSVDKSADQPALTGLRVAQVARHQGSLSAAWQPTEDWMLKLAARAASRQFEDDLNARTLDSYATFDIYVERALIRNTRLYVALENAFDATVEAGKSATGLVTIGTARNISGGLRVAF